MRKVKLLFISLVMASAMGCASKNTVTAPIPGAINSFDQTSYTTLMQAQAGINAVKADVASGKVVLTATQKTVINQAIHDNNIAQAAYQAYHSGATSDTAGLTAAISQIVADIAALATQIQGAK